MCALLACGGGGPRLRAVSLSPAITRVVAALGLSDAVTPVDPRAPDAIPRAMASGAQVALADAGSGSAAVRAVFASRDVAVHVYAPETTDQVLAAYREIAALLGDEAAGRKLGERVTAELDRLAAGVPADGRPKVALVLQRKPLRVVSGDAFLSRLLAAAGADNAFGDAAGASIAPQPELIAARRPRLLDVPPDLAAEAWVDPSAAVQRLREALAPAPR